MIELEAPHLLQRIDKHRRRAPDRTDRRHQVPRVTRPNSAATPRRLVTRR
jgi:hypothetical protein